MLKTFTLLFIGFILTLSSCKTSADTDFEVHQSEIITISAPTSAVLSEEASISVSFLGPNGCSEPYDIKAEKVGQTITLKAFYKLPKEPIMCTEALVLHTLNYHFFPELPGAHFFQSAHDNSIADTIMVY